MEYTIGVVMQLVGAAAAYYIGKAMGYEEGRRMEKLRFRQ